MTQGYHGFHNKLVERFGQRIGAALYSLIASSLAVAVAALLAYAFKQPLLFPSLGPTAYLFFESPMSPRSTPRNTIVGHLVAVVAGGISLAIFGLVGAPSILQAGPELAYVASGILSVGLTGAVVVVLGSSHPLAGATTLIVSLGLLNTVREMLTLMAGVIILTAAGWAINRVFGVPVAVWSTKSESSKS